MDPKPIIMIVDDDGDLVRTLSIRLKAEGFQPVAAQDGSQAEQFARTYEPDLILLDVNMPAGNGFSVHQRLKENAPKAVIPVIYMTGESSDRMDQLTLVPDVIGVLTKPFAEGEPMRTIKEALLNQTQP